LERDPWRVREDVREELVSREAAEQFYGVALRDDLSIDDAATEALRARLRASRGAASSGAAPTHAAGAE
jgi:N-methylhydantoinase B